MRCGWWKRCGAQGETIAEARLQIAEVKNREACRSDSSGIKGVLLRSDFCNLVSTNASKGKEVLTVIRAQISFYLT
jgi:hypothetical protein